MSSIPMMKDVMTAAPRTIGVDDTVGEASHAMVEYNCRHLPVLDGGKLVGVISDRDLSLALNVFEKKPNELLVRSVFVEHPYTAQVTDKLDKVLNDMVALHIGSTLVCDGEELAGIFTTMDACSAFSAHLSGP